MNWKLAVGLVILSAWAILVLTYTRPWPSPDSLLGAYAIIVVGLSLYAAVLSPVIYFIGAPLYGRREAKA